jgi:hypothetical protein
MLYSVLYSLRRWPSRQHRRRAHHGDGHDERLVRDFLGSSSVTGPHSLTAPIATSFPDVRVAAAARAEKRRAEGDILNLA